MRTLIPWRPARELSVFSGDFDDLVRRFFPEEGISLQPAGGTYPKLESFMKDGNFVVRADLPGIDSKKVEVSVEGGRLRIRGEREEKHESTDRQYHYREVSYGRFERSIALPEGTDPDSVTASYRDGVLEVVTTLPKEKSKKVSISVH